MAATGLAAECFEAMCLSWFTGTVLDLSGLDLTEESTAASVLSREWVLARASRACPCCLSENGGVWPLWWQLGVAAACPRHAVLLVDRCPRCGQRLQRGAPGQSGSLLRNGVAGPLVCGKAGAPGSRRGRHEPCGQRMDSLATTAASAELVAVQREVLDIVFGAPSVVLGVPVSGREWIAGLRFAAALHRLFATEDYVRSFPGMVPEAAEEFLAGDGSGAPAGPGERPRRLRIPQSPAHAAADLLLSYPVVSAGDSQECADLLVPLAAAEAELISAAERFPDRRGRMWRVERPEALGQVWRAIRRSRHQAFDSSVRRLVRGRAAMELRVEHLPQLVGGGDYRALLAGRLSGFMT